MQTGGTIDTFDTEVAVENGQAQIWAKIRALPDRPCKNPYCRTLVVTPPGGYRKFCTRDCSTSFDHHVGELRNLRAQIEARIDAAGARQVVALRPALNEINRRLDLHGQASARHLTSLDAEPPSIRQDADTAEAPETALRQRLVLQANDPSEGDLPRLWTRLMERLLALDGLVRRADVQRHREGREPSGIPVWQDRDHQHRLTELLRAVRDLTAEAASVAGGDAPRG